MLNELCCVQKATEDELKKFGENVRRLRKDRKLTQMDLAILCELDHITVMRIERGYIGPSLHVIISIAKALKVEAWELLKLPK